VTVTNAAGTSAISAADKFTYTNVAVTSACGTGQYQLSQSDGATWATMDGTSLSVTFTPSVASYAIIGGNSDLWTTTAGVNQDLGIAVTGGAFPTTSGQPEAWKESGGMGTFSPNAAFVQTVINVASGTPYTAKLVWKANAATAGTIFAGAGPIMGKNSNTCVNFRLVPVSAASLMTGVSTKQFALTGSDGAAWMDMDPALSVTISPSTSGTILVSGNSDMWTQNAGFNQDFGITVAATGYPTTAGQPEAWKESGGASTFAPNASFVQAALPVSAGGVTVKLQWKAHTNDPGTIRAGAGSGPAFSPTRLTVLFLSGTSAPVDKVSTQQYTLSNSDGKSWLPVDLGRFTLTYTPTSDCQVIVGANSDLWTQTLGINQDIGIAMNDGTTPTVPGQPEAWKESGGSGTFAPNAAYLQTTQTLLGGHSYTFQLVWKTNGPASGATIRAGAGPIAGLYSPTRLTLQPVGC
jgi:hypothetical protein